MNPSRNVGKIQEAKIQNIYNKKVKKTKKTRNFYNKRS